MISSSSSNKPLKRAGTPKARTSYNNDQRKALRAWWKEPTSGKRTQADAAAWWKAKYGGELSKQVISRILSKEWEWLDTTDLSKHQKGVHKNRKCDWPALEEALLEWQIRYDRHPDAGPTTGEVLRTKATEFWHKLPEYKDLPLPFEEGKTWSNGFMQGFKARANMQEKRRFGEATSAQINMESEAIMNEIRRVAARYHPDDIYNCDETGSYWKDRPDRTLSTFDQPGRKLEKARITFHLTTNATGSHKLPLWIIGLSKVPNAFRAAGLRDLDGLGVKYRSNKKAWMRNGIFLEYLIWFDNIMRARGRHVLLLMDNFSAHTLAVDDANTLQCLTNTKIMWLPSNTTAKHQPLDQGIIQNWKTILRRRAVQFMVNCFDNGQNFSEELDILKHIRWGIWAWNEVKPSVIANCWDKSQCIDLGSYPNAPFHMWDGCEESFQMLRRNFERLRQFGVDATVDNIMEYIAPAAECIADGEDDLDTLVDTIVAQRVVEEEDSESTEEIVEKEPISHTQALDAVKLLIAYQEEQSIEDLTFKKLLEKRERELALKAVEARVPKSILDYFNTK